MMEICESQNSPGSCSREIQLVVCIAGGDLDRQAMACVVQMISAIATEAGGEHRNARPGTKHLGKWYIWSIYGV